MILLEDRDCTNHIDRFIEEEDTENKSGEYKSKN